MILPVLRPLALTAALSLASLAASAQTFGEFLSKPELPVTFIGVDFSDTRYYGPPLTVDQAEMKGEFIRINDLLVREAKKYDIGKALHRKGETVYATIIAASVNQKIDPATIIMPAGAPPRAAFTPETVQGLVSHYNYPAGISGIGLVFVVEDIVKNHERETFWVTFVDLNTKQMLFTEKIAGTGEGFGFRNHWARPFYSGLDTMKYQYGTWKKKFAKK